MIVHSHKSKINLFESVFRVFFQLSNGCTSLRVEKDNLFFIQERSNIFITFESFD